MKLQSLHNAAQDYVFTCSCVLHCLRYKARTIVGTTVLGTMQGEAPLTQCKCKTEEVSVTGN